MPATSFVQALKRTGYTQFTDKGINGQQMTKWQTRILQQWQQQQQQQQQQQKTNSKQTATQI
ncbi:hypothetical protein FOQG_03517 [Fusarium oxysporum f. sp. raphani 54005]|uniref:Uncharacterized protein n=1 Tax=Fusarium oxysporum f. sp. raphani 54005 TaxID=1089458 RepID=X0CYX5_FUSOX|nr:hypothetical protein FOQG_03517 [Fusarium oxysporum f. sp. raphani 54005]